MMRVLANGVGDLVMALQTGEIAGRLRGELVRGIGALMHGMTIEAGHRPFLETGRDRHAQVFPPSRAYTAIGPESISVRILVNGLLVIEDKLMGFGEPATWSKATSLLQKFLHVLYREPAVTLGTGFR